jgi:hypothetical protein
MRCALATSARTPVQRARGDDGERETDGRSERRCPVVGRGRGDLAPCRERRDAERHGRGTRRRDQEQLAWRRGDHEREQDHDRHHPRQPRKVAGVEEARPHGHRRDERGKEDLEHERERQHLPVGDAPPQRGEQRGAADREARDVVRDVDRAIERGVVDDTAPLHDEKERVAGRSQRGGRAYARAGLAREFARGLGARVRQGAHRGEPAGRHQPPHLEALPLHPLPVVAGAERTRSIGAPSRPRRF